MVVYLEEYRWITRADFEDMRRLGLNLVRIPIGCEFETRYKALAFRLRIDTNRVQREEADRFPPLDVYIDT
jgi:aryl-phospho-beta-D-glucosidase BglC (GH1 family)